RLLLGGDGGVRGRQGQRPRARPRLHDRAPRRASDAHAPRRRPLRGGGAAGGDRAHARQGGAYPRRPGAGGEGGPGARGGRGHEDGERAGQPQGWYGEGDLRPGGGVRGGGRQARHGRVTGGDPWRPAKRGSPASRKKGRSRGERRLGSTPGSPPRTGLAGCVSGTGADTSTRSGSGEGIRNSCAPTIRSSRRTATSWRRTSSV